MISFFSARDLNCHRASVTRVSRDVVERTYPTMLVLPDGATITVRYKVPRAIIKVKNHKT